MRDRNEDDNKGRMKRRITTNNVTNQNYKTLADSAASHARADPGLYNARNSQESIRNYLKLGRAKGYRDGSPQWDLGAKPWYGVWGQSPPEAEAKFEIGVQFLTFSYTKIRI